MKLSCLSLLFAFAPVAKAQNPNLIRINQVGYYPNAPKVAVVEQRGFAKKYTLRDAKTNKTVWQGKAVEQTVSPWSGKRRSTIDFSTVTTAGEYILSNGKQQQKIVIRDGALHDLAVGSMKAFYLQRCSEPILEEYAGKYARPAGHMDNEVLVHPSAEHIVDAAFLEDYSRPTGTKISSPGGWYDAGDFNKYIVNSSFSIGLMLCAYEANPEYFKNLGLNIPESKNSLPDYLDEIAVNLRWMLTMQDFDGGVYHKLTTPSFEGFVMPKDCHQTRYVVMKSTAATLDFAATMAKASRIYRKFKGQERFADEMLSKAVMAYSWAKANPEVLYKQDEMNAKHDPDISTGTYGDFKVIDEFKWATTELALAGIQDLIPQFANEVYKQDFYLPTWGDVENLARYARLGDCSKANIADAAPLIRYADQCIESAEHSSFASAFGNAASDFCWGCNAECAAGKGIALLYAYRLTNDKKYLNAAIGVADYMLGRNATGYCYVTGFGNYSPKHPHQRLSAADGIDEPLPGFLVGGPNPGQQDRDYCKSYTSSYPDESYADDDTSYASNEIAINWNASLAAFICWLEAEMAK